MAAHPAHKKVRAPTLPPRGTIGWWACGWGDDPTCPKSRGPEATLSGHLPIGNPICFVIRPTNRQSEIVSQPSAWRLGPLVARANPRTAHAMDRTRLAWIPLSILWYRRFDESFGPYWRLHLSDEEFAPAYGIYPRSGGGLSCHKYSQAVSRRRFRRPLCCS